MGCWMRLDGRGRKVWDPVAAAAAASHAVFYSSSGWEGEVEEECANKNSFAGTKGGNYLRFRRGRRLICFLKDAFR